MRNILASSSAFLINISKNISVNDKCSPIRWNQNLFVLLFESLLSEIEQNIVIFCLGLV